VGRGRGCSVFALGFGARPVGREAVEYSDESGKRKRERNDKKDQVDIVDLRWRYVDW
jgi:hypothetical protein